jgi:hypothetical protein
MRLLPLILAMVTVCLELPGQHAPPKNAGDNLRPPRTFHFSAKGNDTADGTTPGRAWRSFDRLRDVKLVAGDEIILAEGDEFHGGIKLLPEAGGTAQNPIVIRGSGKRRATITALDSPAILATSGGIEIRDLILKGNPVLAAGQKPHAGISFYTDDGTGRRHSHIRIERVEIVGFSGDGVSISSWHEQQPGYEDVLIQQVTAHHNGGTGILLFGKRDPQQKTYPHRRITLRDCTVTSNHSGSGVVLGGVEDGMVEHCYAADNSGQGGGVALWAYDSKRVTFRSCIATGTRTKQKDGGGFDLDGGCIECVVERCLSYDNHGPGFMHCDYPGAGITRSNVIRSCISINDGQREQGAASGFGFVVWGAGLTDCIVEKNLAYVDDPGHKLHREGLLFASFTPGFAKKNDRTRIDGCIFRKNIAIANGKDVPLVSNTIPEASPKNVRFEGNTFLTLKTEPLFLHGEKRYLSLAEWQKATEQEMRDGKSTAGKFPADAIVLPADYRLRDPRALDKWPLFKAIPE